MEGKIAGSNPLLGAFVNSPIIIKKKEKEKAFILLTTNEFEYIELYIFIILFLRN